jgi:MFS family permease
VTLVLGTLAESVTIETILLRNATPKTRGLMHSSGVSFGYIGLLLFSLGGGILFDKFGARMPFLVVGCLDLFFAFVCILLACCGVLKNDIEPAKRRPFHINN